MSSCPWVFKGTECAYSGGESTCDQTYERCRFLSNTDNFGGDRFINSLMQKEIWWGRTQKL
jgi:phage-related protein